MVAQMNILCLFAHQDDEIAMATRIRFESRAGNPIYCAMLTNGSAYGMSSAVRDAESLTVLKKLGVSTDRIFFLGSRQGIADRKLVYSLEHCLELLEIQLSSTVIDQIFCLAWEGGHPDHDASHLLALALARRRGLLPQTWQFSLYHGRGMPGGLFRVMTPLTAATKWQRRRITLRDAVSIALLVRHYRSQRSSWVGLLPETLLRLLLFRREIMQPVSREAVLSRPHEGALLYERRFGVDYDAWRTAAEPFIRRYVFADGTS
jgi:LmbE family N-acetylglucosaminyl deacetylase